MTNAIKMLLQMQSGFLQLESTLDKTLIVYVLSALLTRSYYLTTSRPYKTLSRLRHVPTFSSQI
jgi:hypothetical protein